jgi:xylose dehydrogenase (NAD/NADP)
MTAVTFLRVGLSGCGVRGAAVIEAVRSHGHCDVVALHDPDARAMQDLGEGTGIDLRCASFDELLATGVDFVVLANPPGSHPEEVGAAATQGVHCLVHAPFAIDAAAAAAMVAAADAGEIKLGVAVPAQADPLLEQLRQMLTEDFLGGIVLVQGVVGEDRMLRQPPGPKDWRRDPALAGSTAFVQLAAGLVHLSGWLSGRAPTTVQALSASGFTALPEDGTVVAATLRGGALCTLAATHLAEAEQLLLLGTDGSALYTPARLVLRGRKEWRCDLFHYAHAGEEQVIERSGLGDPLLAAAADLELHGRFARWIDDRDDFPCPGEQAMLDQRVLDAVARAVRSGGREHV